MIEEKVIEIISICLKTDKNLISIENDLQNDLNADSLHLIEIVLNVEEFFKIKIPDNEADELETVSQIIKYVENYLK